MSASKARRKGAAAKTTTSQGKGGSDPRRRRGRPTGKKHPDGGKEAKAGSKQAILIERLTGSSGATIEGLTKTLGWLPHSVRAALTGLRRKVAEPRQNE